MPHVYLKNLSNKVGNKIIILKLIYLYICVCVCVSQEFVPAFENAEKKTKNLCYIDTASLQLNFERLFLYQRKLCLPAGSMTIAR